MRGVPRQRVAISGRARLVNLDAKNFRRALQDDLEVLVGVELQPQHDAEARAQRRRQQSRARGGADEGERRTSMVWVRADGPCPMMMSSL